MVSFIVRGFADANTKRITHLVNGHVLDARAPGRRAPGAARGAGPRRALRGAAPRFTLPR